MRLRIFAAAVGLCVASAAAHADPVTYTLTGTFTGTIGLISFTNDPGTFTYVSDTANTTSPIPGYYLNGGGTGTVTLAGITTATIDTTTLDVTSDPGGVGFLDLGTGFTVGLEDPGLSNYALTFPFTDSGALTDGFLGVTGPEATSLGDLIITDGDFTFGDTTFTAVGATPEPSSFALLGTGLLGAVAVVRRRFVTR